MTVLVSELIAQTRDKLDETGVGGQWSNTQIRRWINEALKDLARVTQILRDTATITLVAGTAEYTVPENVMEIIQAWYIDGSGSNRYTPLVQRQYEGMDNIWGDQQNQAGAPLVYTVWGASPLLKLRVYPVPVNNGFTQTIKLMVVRSAVSVAIDGSGDNTAIDWPEVWSDALVAYAEYCALRKDRDPRWQEAWQRYTEVRDQLLVMGDYLNVNRDVLYDPYVGYGSVPAWLAGFD